MSEQNSPANFTFYPLLWLAICFALGILIGNFLHVIWHIFLIISLICGIFTIFFIKQKIHLVFISLAFIAVGGLCLTIENQGLASNRLKKIYDEKRIESGDPLKSKVFCAAILMKPSADFLLKSNLKNFSIKAQSKKFRAESDFSRLFRMSSFQLNMNS